jgi:hypothetical protein
MNPRPHCCPCGRHGEAGTSRRDFLKTGGLALGLGGLTLSGLKWMQIWAYLSFYLRPRSLYRALRDASSGGQILDLQHLPHIFLMHLAAVAQRSPAQSCH